MKKTILSIALWITTLAPISVIVGYCHLPSLHPSVDLPAGLLMICGLLSAIGFAIHMESTECPAPLKPLEKEIRISGKSL